MKNYTKQISKQIADNNLWYTDSQFVWAEQESIRRIYEQRFLFFYKIIKKAIVERGNITLLDYGCGDGYWSLVFAQFSLCEVSGIDYNRLRLNRCKENIPKAKFIEADLRKVNDCIGKFDIVFCSQVIEHIEDDLSFLQNIKNHLKENGILILGTTNEGCLTQKLGNYFTKGQTDHIHFYTEKEIVTKIEKAGFTIKNTYREVFYAGVDKLYYKLTASDLGFKILELLTILLPSQCSDYYFECKMK